jgi:hypothetical protein
MKKKTRYTASDYGHAIKTGQPTPADRAIEKEIKRRGKRQQRREEALIRSIYLLR